MARLTRREQEVVRLLAQGKRQTEIARVLCVSTRTVEAHCRSARYKTGTNNTMELAIRAAIEEHEKK